MILSKVLSIYSYYKNVGKVFDELWHCTISDQVIQIFYDVYFDAILTPLFSEAKRYDESVSF